MPSWGFWSKWPFFSWTLPSPWKCLYTISFSGRDLHWYRFIGHFIMYLDQKLCQGSFQQIRNLDQTDLGWKSTLVPKNSQITKSCHKGAAQLPSYLKVEFKYQCHLHISKNDSAWLYLFFLRIYYNYHLCKIWTNLRLFFPILSLPSFQWSPFYYFLIGWTYSTQHLMTSNDLNCYK